jgi:hydroxymethylglutaryl-CoA lyase
MKLQHIIIEEQGLRDGLQTLAINIPVEKKIAWINNLIAAGLKKIQVTSFVHPALVPQMADAEELIKNLPQTDSVVFSALALNIKGVQRAINSSLKNLSLSISASNLHSQKNTNKTIAQAKIEFAEMVLLAQKNNIVIRGGIQCAFGCRYEGKIDESRVLDLVKHHLDKGVQEIALADSTGMGNPYQIKKMMEKVLHLCEAVPVTLHLHNTENKGYANLVAALEVGVTQFDTAFGGLGGCPFIKGATGNVATEDVVHLLNQMGFETGIDFKKVAVVSNQMEKILQQKLPGLLYQLEKEKLNEFY